MFYPHFPVSLKLDKDMYIQEWTNALKEHFSTTSLTRNDRIKGTGSPVSWEPETRSQASH